MGCFFVPIHLVNFNYRETLRDWKITAHKHQLIPQNHSVNKAIQRQTRRNCIVMNALRSSLARSVSRAVAKEQSPEKKRRRRARRAENTNNFNDNLNNKRSFYYKEPNRAGQFFFCRFSTLVRMSFLRCAAARKMKNVEKNIFWFLSARHRCMFLWHWKEFNREFYRPICAFPPWRFLAKKQKSFFTPVVSLFLAQLRFLNLPVKLLSWLLSPEQKLSLMFFAWISRLLSLPKTKKIRYHFAKYRWILNAKMKYNRVASGAKSRLVNCKLKKGEKLQPDTDNINLIRLW